MFERHTQRAVFDFEGESIRRIPTASRLEGLDADAFYKEFKDRANLFRESPEEVFELLLEPKPRTKTKNIVRGANVPSLILANQIFREIGYRTPTPVDYEKIRRANLGDKKNRFALKGISVDTGLVLRHSNNLAGYNDNLYHAESLCEQIREMYGEGKLHFPVVIPYYGLDLVVDSNAPEKYGLRLREDGEIIHVPILEANTGGQYFEDQDVDMLTGFPRGLKTQTELKRLASKRRLFQYGYCLCRVSVDGKGIITTGWAYLNDMGLDHDPIDENRIIAVRD